MKNNCLTVLLVTYNHKNSIAKAIESILCQKTDFAFQIWILDDCSTDGTSEIVTKYAKEYPEKIIPFIREKNMGATQNVYSILPLIKTKYYAALEGDDFWCDENKLQMQIDALENNPDCSFCAHNSFICTGDTPPPGNPLGALYLQTEQKKWKFPKKIHKSQYVEPHYSSRVYRTECLHLEKIKNPLIACYDIASNFWFLSQGNLYYIDKPMSVYNYTGAGIYSGLSSEQQRHMSASVIFEINKEFDFKYNSMFLKFISMRFPISFWNYLKLRFFTSKKDLEKTYRQIFDRYAEINLKKMNKKHLFQYVFNVSKKKRLVLELRREREI